jgi:hypothetical protein
MKGKKEIRRNKSPFSNPGVAMISWTRCENYYMFESRIKGDMLSLHPSGFDFGGILWKEIKEA